MSEPQYLLLDDCLSAVDTATEAAIANNLNEWLGERTLIFITHRIITALSFSQIMVLDNGHIIEKGNHDELMKKGGYYAKLYQRQLLLAGSSCD
jgi:ATP-binding cassette subfamily B protein